MSGLRIIPLKVGAVTRMKSLFNLKDQVPFEVPLVMWYIEGANKKIVIDTGGSDPEAELSKKYRYPYVRTAAEEPVNALKKLGVSPEEVDIVINTHLHWDHCYNNHLFPKATFIVQKKEMQFAVAPIPTQEHTYEAVSAGMVPPWVGLKNWEIIDGDEKLTDGIDLLLTPGHTKGSQSVLVQTDAGPYLVATDTVPLFENWKGKKSVPSGIHVSLEEYFETFKKIAALDSFVLPGHDPDIFRCSVYPEKQ